MAVTRKFNIIRNVNDTGIFSLVVTIGHMEHKRLVAFFAGCHIFFCLYAVLKTAVEVEKFPSQELHADPPELHSYLTRVQLAV